MSSSFTTEGTEAHRVTSKTSVPLCALCGEKIYDSRLNMTTSSTQQAAAGLLRFSEEHRDDMLSVLRQMVEMESPSDNKDALDRLGAHLAREFERMGGKVTVHREKVAGDNLSAEFPGRSGAKPVLLLGHFDTVWPMGTLSRMPFRVDGGRVRGPGVLDMKAGITMMMFALRALRVVGSHPDRRPVIIALDTDEEVGSTTGRPLVETVAKNCEAVLVLEPAQGLAGHLKTSRKGVGDFTIRVTGRASHAGVDFEKGHSAIVELSRQILDVAKFTDIARGITVNPGVIQGGTRTNVVAAEASAEVDIRIARIADAEELESKFAGLRPYDPECKLEVSGGINRPPMERTAGTVRLFQIAQEQASKLGMTLEESSTGGGSDGNFTSALGIPTLDGLGAVGEGAHADHESFLLEELPRRTALLASLIVNI
jgi:glutamate carboxypeptidase